MIRERKYQTKRAEELRSIVQSRRRDRGPYFFGMSLSWEELKTLGMDEELFSRQIYCLGKYYGDVLVGSETNFSTYPVKELQRAGVSQTVGAQEGGSLLKEAGGGVWV